MGGVVQSAGQRGGRTWVSGGHLPACPMADALLPIPSQGSKVAAMSRRSGRSRRRAHSDDDEEMLLCDQGPSAMGLPSGPLTAVAVHTSNGLTRRPMQFWRPLNDWCGSPPPDLQRPCWSA